MGSILQHPEKVKKKLKKKKKKKKKKIEEDCQKHQKQLA